MTVRLGALGDLAAICAIEDASFSDPWSEADLRRAFDSEICRYLVAEDGGDVVGYALFSVLYEDAEIMSVAVAPECRRAGIGGALLRRVLECAAVAEAETAFLEVRASNSAALALYEKFGFRRIRTVKSYYRRPTEDAVVMALDLAEARAAT